jgi:hypothetical protein
MGSPHSLRQTPAPAPMDRVLGFVLHTWKNFLP